MSMYSKNNEIDKIINEYYGIIINKYNRLGKKDECDICKEDKILIPLECSHYVCVQCIFNINKCHLCKHEINKNFRL